MELLFILCIGALLALTMSAAGPYARSAARGVGNYAEAEGEDTSFAAGRVAAGMEEDLNWVLDTRNVPRGAWTQEQANRGLGQTMTRFGGPGATPTRRSSTPRAKWAASQMRRVRAEPRPLDRSQLLLSSAVSLDGQAAQGKQACGAAAFGLVHAKPPCAVTTATMTCASGESGRARCMSARAIQI
ncbi:MAG: hypothetical protein AAGJ32_01100 [Pseudomonadota bacterium]